MIQTVKKYIKQHVFPSRTQEKGVVEAYDLWADNYDAQPGNLMLDLDDKIIINLFADVEFKNKEVADIGCGTGRHWAKVFRKSPASLTGFDVSQGMLDKLTAKFPSAQTYRITDNHFSAIPDHTYDVVLSTLTVAHIADMEEALNAWSRIAKLNSDIIITDFHPDALAFGGKRTFRHQNAQIAVQNFVHPTDTIKNILLKQGFHAVNEVEKRVDESVECYYREQNALHVYEKFKGFPIIYGIHFKREI